MRLLRLKLENFRSHEDLDLDLAGVECAAVIGPNGAGKSSLLLGVYFALYGGGADELISRSADQGGVTLTLEQGGKIWRVSRGRERGRKSWLAVEEAAGDGEKFTPHATRTIAEAQAFIDGRITGMDADAFRASVYAPQGEAGVLAAMGPGQRKALLGGLLGLEQYEGWRERAALDARGAKAAAENARTRAEATRQRLEDLKLRFELDVDLPAMLKAKHDEVEQHEKMLGEAIEREKMVEQVRRREDLVRQMEGVKARASEAKEREAKEETARKRIEEIGDVSEQLEAERQAKSDHEAAAARAQGEKASLSRAQAAASQAAHRLDEDEQLIEATKAKIAEAEKPGAACPTCGQEVAGDHKEKVVADLRAELEARESKLPSLRAEYSEAQKVVDGASAPADPEPFDTTKLRALEKVDAERSHVEGQLLALKGHEGLPELRSEWERLKAEAEGLPRKVEEGSTPAEVRDAIRIRESQVTDLEQRIREDERARKEAEEVGAEAGVLDAEAAESEQSERALAVVAKAFSRDGIPAMILDNAVGSIEAAANEALETLGVAMSIRLVTQRTTGKGTLAETLDILVDDGTMERKLETFSGGEQYRVHIALRLGLATVLSASGVELECLLIDEPTDLDAAGVTMLADLLVKLPMQVILVTHQDALTDAIPQRIVVERASAADPSSVDVH